jgi:NADH-quinone oxidoreductase subunit K
MQTASNVIWNLSVSHFLVLAAVLFTVGAFGALLRRNALIVLMSVELMLNAGNMTLLAFSRLHHDMRGHVFSLFVIAIAAAEAAVGLAIVIALFRHRESLNPDAFTNLKW